jgi:hypothetical protein
MENKRTSVDFSKHTHTVEIYKCGVKEIRVDTLQFENSRENMVQFINTSETMSVTGDFGNWIFCRPFIPSSKNYVSSYYWIEKLRTLSEQKLDELDLEAISQKIEQELDHGLGEYGYTGDRLQEAKDWYSELLEHTDEEADYIEFIHRGYPELINIEDIPFYKKTPVWLNIIFDAFDEICDRSDENGKDIKTISIKHPHKKKEIISAETFGEWAKIIKKI